MTRESARAIEEAAAMWLARLDRHGHTPELTGELAEWIAGDPRREGAMLRARATWHLIHDHLGDEAADVPSAEPAMLRMPVFTRRRLLWAGGVAAAASVAGGIFLGAGESYRTGIGEIRRVPLADGSTAAINTDSRVTVSFAPDVRTVRLARGEAWFQVAKDRARPFVVAAGRVRVEAVGTAFSVRRRAGGADVMVTEGTVIAWADGADGHRIRLSAGEGAFLADNAAILRKPVAAADIDRSLAWRSGQIDFAGMALAGAIDEFNRYNVRKIVLADPALAREPLFGLFRADDPEGFAQTVHQGLSVPVTLTGRDTIVIGAPAPPAAR
ncbi:FecR family protein [Sphingomonas sp.]|uniref:FecR family protein n=1 Tax=Sphingomonas sp. TaxID=28214 RepID=UPI003D6D3CAA